MENGIHTIQDLEEISSLASNKPFVVIKFEKYLNTRNFTLTNPVFLNKRIYIEACKVNNHRLLCFEDTIEVEIKTYYSYKYFYKYKIKCGEMEVTGSLENGDIQFLMYMFIDEKAMAHEELKLLL